MAYSRKPKSRVSVLSKVVTKTGDYDEATCQKLLGDYYDIFIRFCNHLEIMTDEIDSVGLTEFNAERGKVLFNIRKKNGEEIDIET